MLNAPMILGHEASGRIVAVGADVDVHRTPEAVTSRNDNDASAEIRFPYDPARNIAR
ncbi:MAG: hypothetical protein ACNYNX_08355 [Leucobacter sp.]